MIEHRWIERMIADVRARLGEPASRKTIDSQYVGMVVDFLRTYADRCHHGKEEDILFEALAQKDLEPSLKQTMERLSADHQWARATTRLLVAANASLAAGDPASLEEVRRLLGELAAFYPEHIRLEDKAFFRPIMTYLSADEQAAMLKTFAEFDASLIHEKYRRLVQDLGPK
jgi:hemerythrin-like domain-containing protein